MSRIHAGRLRPLTIEGRGYELLDLGGRPMGRYLTLQQALDAIAERPRRTVHVVRLWILRDGVAAVEKQWLISIGLDGVYRTAETRKHWTMDA